MEPIEEPLDPELMDHINQALFRGRLIDAIKLYRQATGADLKQAKDFVQALEARLRAQMPERFTAPPSTVIQVGAAGCLVMVMLLAVGCVLLMLLLKR
jgi:ribosomal protein L7/L12